MRKALAGLSGALMLLIAALWCSASSLAAGGPSHLQSTIAFTSTRDNTAINPQLAAEVYLMNPDGTNPQRLTDNSAGDGLPTLSPDGRRIVFDSNRNRAPTEPLNTSDLFVMKTDGTEQSLLTRGSSATWSPDGKQIAFHASASGTGTPEATTPGAATTDSDIFVAQVDETGVEQRTNITNNGSTTIDEDPDWSPDGQTIVYERHAAGAARSTSEIYLINADGTGTPQQLTSNSEDERGPSWSPDGTQIVFAGTGGDTLGGTTSTDFEIWVMNENSDGTWGAPVQLTHNSVPDLTPTFSPDGQQIAFHRTIFGQGQQMFRMDADGSAQRQLTVPPGVNNLADWGVLRVAGQEPAP